MLFRGVPNSCLHFVLKRQALISWPARFARSQSCFHPSPFPRFLPSFFPLPSISSPLRGETLIQFHLARADKLTSLSLFLFLSLPPSFPYSLSFRATSPSQSLLYCLLKTIYNLNPPWSIGGKCSLFPANGTRANRIAGYSRRTLIICWSISVAFVEFGNYPIMFLEDEGCSNWE